MLLADGQKHLEFDIAYRTWCWASIDAVKPERLIKKTTIAKLFKHSKKQVDHIPKGETLQIGV